MVFEREDKIFFTADTHFLHKNIIDHCNRPYKDIDDMETGLIDNWNSVVTPDSIVYHIGDFMFPVRSRDKHKVDEVLSKLNGTKLLITGNHDHKEVTRSKHWSWVGDYKVVVVKGKERRQEIVLFHFPMRSWHHIGYGAWHLHGHCHGNIPPYGRSIDVGVDCFSYTPLSLSQVRHIMDDIEVASPDYH